MVFEETLPNLTHAYHLRLIIWGFYDCPCPLICFLSSQIKRAFSSVEDSLLYWSFATKTSAGTQLLHEAKLACLNLVFSYIARESTYVIGVVFEVLEVEMTAACQWYLLSMKHTALQQCQLVAEWSVLDANFLIRLSLYAMSTSDTMYAVIMPCCSLFQACPLLDIVQCMYMLACT